MKIETNCGITNRNLSGSFLIEFLNCSIILDNTKFENTERFKMEMPLIIPLNGLEIKQQIIENPIEDLHILNRNHLETLSTNHTIHHYSSISLSVCSILGIITLIILYKVKSKNININFRRNTVSVESR